MSPPGIKAVLCCGWLAAVEAHTCLESWAHHFKAHALKIVLHCFCRSDRTEKNTKHFDLSSVPKTTTYDIQRSSFFFGTTIMYS